MDHKVSQYQRAVTPTIDNSLNSSGLRGKILSYSSSNSNSTRAKGYSSNPNSQRITNGSFHGNGLNDITVQGRATASSSSIKVIGSESAPNHLLRFDLIPINDEVPADGIIFARIRNQHDSIVVFKTQEERLRNPERLNLDRRQLDNCPLLEQEQRLRLLNYQNNRIRKISNLENLPNLIFLDLYNNQISSLEGPLNCVSGLRVLMAGKNKISQIRNLNGLKKLDVLDLHSNEIKMIEGLEGLSELRVLNLAGNRLTVVDNLQSLSSLTELNLRRNYIQQINGLNALPSLQRIFLSHNSIQNFQQIQCIFEIQYLIELSMDGNPVSEQDSGFYRRTLILNIPTLRHLDLKRISDEERATLIALQSQSQVANNTIGNQSLKNLKEIWSPNTQKITSAPNPHLDIQGEFQFLVPISNIPLALENDNDANIDSISNDIKNLTTTDSNGADKSSHDQYIPTATEQEYFQNSSFQNSTSLLALIRNGKLARNQSPLLDIEIINNEEKALIGVGDTWEWSSIPRRLLSSVTEAHFVFMKREMLSTKLGSNLLQQSVMTSLKKLCLFGCEFSSLKHIDMIIHYLLANSSVQHLTMDDCKISENLLRSYLIAQVPNLISFNNQAIAQQEREECERHLAPWLLINKKSVKAFTSVKISPSNTNYSVGEASSNPLKPSPTLAESVKASLSDGPDAYIPSIGHSSKDSVRIHVPQSAMVLNSTELSKEFDIYIKGVVKHAIVEVSSVGK